MKNRSHLWSVFDFVVRAAGSWRAVRSSINWWLSTLISYFVKDVRRMNEWRLTFFSFILDSSCNKFRFDAQEGANGALEQTTFE